MAKRKPPPWSLQETHEGIRRSKFERRGVDVDSLSPAEKKALWRDLPDGFKEATIDAVRIRDYFGGTLRIEKGKTGMGERGDDAQSDASAGKDSLS